MTVCNMCGATLSIVDEIEDYSIIKDPLGFGTIYDGNKLDLHICSSCLEKLIQACALPPIESYDWTEPEIKKG